MQSRSEMADGCRLCERPVCWVSQPARGEALEGSGCQLRRSRRTGTGRRRRRALPVRTGRRRCAARCCAVPTAATRERRSRRDPRQDDDHVIQPADAVIHEVLQLERHPGADRPRQREHRDSDVADREGDRRQSRLTAQTTSRGDREREDRRADQQKEHAHRANGVRAKAGQGARQACHPGRVVRRDVDRLLSWVDAQQGLPSAVVPPLPRIAALGGCPARVAEPLGEVDDVGQVTDRAAGDEMVSSAVAGVGWSDQPRHPMTSSGTSSAVPSPGISR